MSLCELIIKGGLQKIATMTHATVATLTTVKTSTVATVTVANYQKMTVEQFSSEAKSKILNWLNTSINPIQKTLTTLLVSAKLISELVNISFNVQKKYHK